MTNAVRATQRRGVIIAMGKLSSEPLTETPGLDFDIQWMPPGHHDIWIALDGKNRRLDFTVSAKHATICNSALQQLRGIAEAGNGDDPFFDFNHEDGPASGHPSELYWAGDDRKQGGIRSKGKWTGSGKDAISRRDYRRFSPSWLPDMIRGGEPMGVPVNLGGLVNRAGFKSISTVLASARRAEFDGCVAIDPQEGIVAQAKALAQSQGISFGDAINQLFRNPVAYAKYRAEIGLPPLRVAVPRSEPERELSPAVFIARAKAFGQANGITGRVAAMTAFGASPEGNRLYIAQRSYLFSKAEGKNPDPDPSRAAEDNARVAGEGSLDPDILEQIGHTLDDHPFLEEARKVMKVGGLPPMRAYAYVARANPDLYRDYQEACEAAGVDCPFKDLDKP